MRVGSLFLRIFLWFWLAMAVVVALLVLLSPAWTRVRPAFARWEHRALSHLLAESESLATIAGRGGPDALAERLRGPHQRMRHLRVFLLDGAGVDTLGKRAAPGLAALADRARRSGRPESERDGLRFSVARPVGGPRGAGMVLVVERAPPGRGERGHPPRPVEILAARALLPIVALIVLVVGLLAYWLTRYLTSPISALRGAARGLAAGDLSARVGDRIGGRSDEIGELARDFDSMAERIENLISAHQRLLRDVSHELRSPLARLSVALGLARRASPEAAARPLERIELETKRLDALIGQLLTISRLEEHGPGREAVEIDLVELGREVVVDADYEARADGKSVTLTGDGAIRVVGHRALLRSALENVVRNGVHHAPPGTVVEVELEAGAELATVTVRDHGPGVAEAELDQLFEPFYRVEEARERVRGGVGLGLAIAARAARAHGGHAAAHNHPGGGLVVEIVLPTADRGGRAKIPS